MESSTESRTAQTTTHRYINTAQMKGYINVRIIPKKTLPKEHRTDGAEQWIFRR